MSKTAAAVALLLLATACGGGSDSAELEVFQAKVATLEARVAAVAPATTTTGGESAWPDDYQTFWMGICESIFVGVQADDPNVSPPDLCRCTLDGLMKAFLLEDYESWPQEVKDGAAAPYATMCWPEG